MTGFELEGTDSFIYSRLSGDAALAALVGVTLGNLGGRVFTERVPQGATPPWVVSSFVSGVDWVALGLPPVRVLTRPIYLIKAVDRSESGVRASQIAGRIDALMNGALGTAVSPAISIFGCKRVELVRYAELDASNVNWFHAGGMFKLFVTKS